jgi:hypothetical protein
LEEKEKDKNCKQIEKNEDYSLHIKGFVALQRVFVDAKHNRCIWLRISEIRLLEKRFFIFEIACYSKVACPVWYLPTV